LARLTDLPALEELNFDSCPIGDWAISHLADNSVVPNLTSLDLADTDLTDLGMVHLAKFKKLRRLSLFYCNITNGGQS
jgi:Leucine-rich repeat (LRR) protein